MPEYCYIIYSLSLKTNPRDFPKKNIVYAQALVSSETPMKNSTKIL